MSTNHPAGEAFFKNQIALVTPQYDADVKTGRALALGATNDLAIPIHNNGGANSFLTYHDIANDEIIQIGNESNIADSFPKQYESDFTIDTDGWTPQASDTVISVAGGQLKIESSVASIYSRASRLFPIEPNVEYTVRINTHIGTNAVSGILRVGVTQFGTDLLNSTFLTDGIHIGRFTYTGTTYDGAYVNVLVNTGNTVGNYTLLDDVIVARTLPRSTTYTFNDVTLNNILTHKMPFSEGDLTLIQQEPNLIAALAMGEATPISSVTLDVDDSWYACGEVSGADVFDARVAGNDTAITGDLTSVRITNQQKGLQTTALLLDANGVPESYNSTPNTARVYDDTIISTGFKPNITRYSIEETVIGELANFGSDITTSTNKIVNTSTDTDVVDTGGNVYNIVSTNFNVNINLTDVSPDAVEVVVSFDAELISGNYVIAKYYANGAFVDLDYDIVEGANSFICLRREGNSTVRLGGGSGVAMEINMSNIQVEEVLLPTQRTEQRLLTHTDAKLGSELVTNGGFDTDLSGWVIGEGAWTWISGKAVTQPADTSYIYQDFILPDTTYIISFDLSDIIGLGDIWAEKFVFRILGTNPIIYNIYLTKDTIAQPTMRFTYTGTITRIQFQSENVVGASIDNVSVREVSTETKYYINGLEQDVTPALPDPAVTINLNDTAVIGYPDTIQSRDADFNVHSTIMVP